MSSSLSRLIYGGDDAANDSKRGIRNSQEISNARRDRVTSSTSSRRQRDLEARKTESGVLSSIPTVQSAKHARKAAKKKTRFDIQGAYDALENDSEEYEADDWNDEDFEELDDDEFESLQSDTRENLHLGNEKASDWRSTIDQQSAFISAIYASPCTHQHDNDDGKTSAPMSSLEDDTEDVSRKIEAVLRPEVVELPIHANLWPDREKRLTPQVRTRRKRQRGFKGFVEEQFVETDNQARYRVALEDRMKEWRLMTQRWKRREYDYTDEVDVGNSIETMARQALSQRELEQGQKKQQERRRRLVLQHRRLEQQQRVKQETVDTGTDTTQHRVDETGPLQQREEYPLTQVEDNSIGVEDDDGEGSFDEQDQVLNRLLQNSASQEARQRGAGTATGDENMENDLKQRERPFQEQLNYWESGRSIPPTKELEFCYGRKDSAIKYPTRRSPVPRNQAGEVVSDGRLSMTLRQFIKPKGGSKPHDRLVGVTNPRWYFPLPFNEANCSDKSRVRGEFVHHRQLRRMSARFLCGGVRNTRGNHKSRQRSIEDRLLRALHSMAPGRGDGLIGRRDWNKRHPYAFHHSHRKHLLLHLTRQRALDIKCFIEHLWSDSSLVAARLGLINHNGFHNWNHQLAGYSMDLQRVREMSQKERNKMLKSRNLGKSIRYRKPIDPYEDEKGDDMVQTSRATVEHDKPVLGRIADCVESWHAPTGDAVVADQQSMMSATKSSITSIKDCFSASYLSGLSLISTGSCNYVHIEGTDPPIPLFPLDPIGIVFGPVDRHAGYHHMAKLDETTLALTISTLVSRMATAPKNDAKNDEEKSRIYYQLQSYLEQAPGLGLINYYKFLATTKSKLQDLPLVNPYHTLMMGCSVVANAFVFYSEDSSVGERKDIGPGGDDDSLYGDKDTDRDNFDAPTEAGMNIVASRIYDHCEGHIQHNGLLRFPRLHLTFAIARLCRRLPAPVAEILSRSTDDGGENSSYHRTAVELMQVAMLYMENNHLIEDGGPALDSEDGAMQVGLLEYWLYEAADVFRRCMKLDFFALDYHMWYISALSACVLLCSGNRIGSGARRYPSARTENGANSYLDPSETNYAPEHEVRRRLPKYEDVRSELACAIRLLLDLAKHQTKGQCGTKMHLAIASVFEWKQMVALLIGGATEGNHAGDDPWSDVRALHKYHATNWVLQDHSSCAREYATRLLDHSNKNNKIHVIAQDLEGDPSKLVHWRRLAEELGPIGKPIEVTKGCISHRSQCSECQRIREMLLVDHETEIEQRNQKDWWASDRRSWWESCLLQMPQYDGRRSKIISDAIDKKMTASGPPVVGLTNKAIPIKSEHQFAETRIVTIHDLSWLTDSMDAQDGNKKPPSDIERTKTFDHLLPQTFLEVLASTSSFDLVENSSNREFDAPSLKGENAQLLEVLCYKVLITCHMYSVNHPSIESAVWSIVMTCWEKKNYTFEDCDEWTALSWLSSRGLSIPQILRDGCSTG